MKLKIFSFIVLLTVLGCASSSHSYDGNKQGKKEIEREIEVKPGGTLTIDLKTGGEISVIGWDKDIVKISAEVDEKVDFDIDTFGSDVEVITRATSWGFGNGKKCEVTAMVPTKYNIDINTMGGEVSIKNVEGNIDGKTMGGELTFSGLKGDISFTTMGGDVKLLDSEIDGKVSTMGGDMRLENIVGNVDASTMGGEIIQKNVKSGSNSVGDEVDISTMGGDIHVDEAFHGASVKTMGGDITVNKAKKYVKAETMGGDIEIKEVDGYIKTTTMGGDIYAKMVGNPDEGRRDVDLSSMGGDITLYVPEGLSMQVEIEIIYGDDDEVNSSDIKSDFEMQTENIEDNSDDWSNDSKKLIQTGSFNGGKHKVRISTINGKVHFKKL